MDMEQIRAIIANAGTWVASIFAGVGGITGIVAIVRALISLKKSKLTDGQINDIADKVVEKMNENTVTSLDVDVSAQIDKATNSRISAVEGKINEFSANLSKVIKGEKAIMAAMSNFRTISNDNRLALMAEVNDENAVESIETAPKAVFTTAPKKDENEKY